MIDARVGCFAISRAGHDKDKMYVILSLQGEYAMVSDGKLKTVNEPKKKSLKHLQLMHRTVNEELLKKLNLGLTVTNEEIKYEIKHYQ